MRVPDTSVIIPALATWHPHHDVARAALGPTTTTVGHCMAESYSVLTRLPEPHRVSPAVASQALSQLIVRTVVLDEEHSHDVPQRMAAAGIRGGATYDGVIALTARQHRATVVTLDVKARRTYEALGVEYEILDAESDGSTAT